MKKKSNIFVTSDCWLGRVNIIELNNRPFSNIQAMDNHIMDIWNQVVNERDVVIILGNFIYDSSYYTEYLMKMTGFKILLPTIMDKASIISNQAILQSQNIYHTTPIKKISDYRVNFNLGDFADILDNMDTIAKSDYGFYIANSNIIESPEHNVIFSTYPLLDWTGKEDGVINIHGGVVQGGVDWCRFNTNMELNEYTPLPLNLLVKTMHTFKSH